ncbi:MAG: acyl-CoA synthetase FdrA [Bryobacteraceae bacterium]|jgi:succinyl-CoA synthetase alpha subunit
MVIRGEIKTGVYFDSVTLMIVGRDITAAPGVLDAAVVMGTRENQAILRSAGLWIDQFAAASDTDLLLAVKAASAETASRALRAAAEQLKTVRARAETAGESLPLSLDGALHALPGANLALISVAGRYAGEQARKALGAGLHVMLFSDNVPLAQEIELKKLTRANGLLLMGPDCGTAIINGVPLAFANVVNRGDIGIVAAAGTGLQEVSTILSNAGAGISQAIGTGGRDVKKEVGGIMFLEGLKALIHDPATRTIVLVSKPPHESVLKKVGKALKGVRKPVIAVFLGAEEQTVRRYGMTPAATLEEAALMACGAAGTARNRGPRPAPPEVDLLHLARSQKYVRGLFCGGTFCTEAQVIFRDQAIGHVHSNVPLPPFAVLPDVWKSQQHTLIDLGEDAFTVGRPHPMIDYSLRNRRILEEAQDSETAVILLDVVLGYGTNMDPAGELAPVICRARGKRRLIFACSVTGTPRDPQNRTRVAEALTAAGAHVFPSNAAACKFAARVARSLEGK